MMVYTINLCLILALAYPLCIYKPSRPKKVLYLAITFGYLWFLATFRFGIGFDYDSYIRIFERIHNAQGFAALMELPYEPGFVFLTKAVATLTQSSVIMYGVYAALIFLPVAWFIYHYCKDAWLSVWLYVTLAHFYASMNFIRQSLACSITLLGYKFLREKKPVPYFAIVLLAATMHKSALVMIPVYFLCHIRLDKKMGIFYASATAVVFLSSAFILDKVTDYIFKAYKDSDYLRPISSDPATSLIFLVVPVFLFAACLALRPLWEKRDKDAGFLLNMLLFSLIAWVFITKHFILERFSQYMYILALVAVPAAISCLKVSDEEKAKLAEMKAGADGKKAKGKSKEETFKMKELAQKISDHEKYYWSAVAALLVLTWIYNSFGANVNGFHGVFPYQSVLDWMP